MQALAWGWDSPATIALLAAGLVVLGLFCAFELRREHPLLDVGLLRRPVLQGILLAMFAAQFVLNGFLIYIATYFQHVLDYGPLLAAVAMTPSVIFSPIFNIQVGRVTDRIGPRRPAIAGYFLCALCFAWIAVFVDGDDYWPLLPGLLGLCVAIAPMFTSLLTGLSNAVSAEERGDANALVLTVRWIGAAAGTMVLGVIVYGGDPSATPSASSYEDAFGTLAVIALLGSLACAVILRDPADRERPRHRHLPHI
jgi:MFS family permease